MRTPPLLANFIHHRVCKPICEKLLTLPVPASNVRVRTLTKSVRGISSPDSQNSNTPGRWAGSVFLAAHTCVCLISRGICYSSSLPDGPQVLIGRAAKQENPCFGLLSVLHLSIRRRRPCYIYGGIFCTFQQTGRYQK